MSTVELRPDRCLYFCLLIFLACYLLYKFNHTESGVSDTSYRNSLVHDFETNLDDFGIEELVKGAGIQIEDADSLLEEEHVVCENLLPRPQWGQDDQLYRKFTKSDAKGGDLFPIQTKKIAILKKICNALEECMGFNTNGWLKKHIGDQYKTKGDLYIKETVQPDEEIYLSSEIIERNYGPDYTRMTKQLKIYIYDVKIGSNITSPNDYKFGVEQLFINLLKKSRFVTQKPEEATFYFIPAHCTAFRKSVSDLDHGVAVAQRLMAQILQDVKQRAPFWLRSQGADHFYICAHDMGAAVAAESDPNLLKNAVALVNTADYEDPYYVPHKDISVPPHPAHGKRSLPELGHGGRGSSPSDRNILAFFAGALDRGRIRPALKEQWSSDPAFRIIDGHLTDLKYQKYLHTSKFCLFPRGYRAWSPRLMDAVWFGCIPVILSDFYHLPLHGLLDWSRLAIFIPESQIAKLKDILEAVSKKQIAQLQARLRQVFPHLTWNDPPQPYDAFHSLLYQLWQRRHVLRYPVDGGKL